jgi:hypothetical protein
VLILSSTQIGLGHTGLLCALLWRSAGFPAGFPACRIAGFPIGWRSRWNGAELKEFVSFRQIRVSI